MRTIALLLLLTVLPVQAETVYRQTDEKGRPVFTDQPAPEAEAVDLAPVNVTPATEVKRRQEPAAPAAEPAIALVSPQQDAVIPNGLAPQTVVVEVTPELASDQRVRVLLDGAQVASGTGTEFVIERMERGSHQMRAVLVDSRGRVLANSDSVSFFVYWPGGGNR